jgi:hypothetical protein
MLNNSIFSHRIRNIIKVKSITFKINYYGKQRFRFKKDQ